MITLTGTENIASFLKQIDLAFAEMDRGISREFEQFTKKLFKELVRTTPQWTGDLAAAWNYSIAYPDETYSPLHNKLEANARWSFTNVYQRGMEPAASIPVLKAASVHPTWRDVVYFHNPAPIADEVENLRVLIRPVNLVDQRVAMIQYYVDRYSSAGGTWA
jgi:hypothetical protein